MWFLKKRLQCLLYGAVLLLCSVNTSFANNVKSDKFLIYAEIKLPGLSDRSQIVDDALLAQVSKAKQYKDISLKELLKHYSSEEAKTIYNSRSYIVSMDHFHLIYSQLQEKNYAPVLTGDKKAADLVVYIKNIGFSHPSVPLVAPEDINAVYKYDDFFNSNISFESNTPVSVLHHRSPWLESLFHVENNRIRHGRILIVLSDYAQLHHLFITQYGEHHSDIYNPNVLVDASQWMDRHLFQYFISHLNRDYNECVSSHNKDVLPIDKNLCLLNHLHKIGSFLYSNNPENMPENQKKNYTKMFETCGDASKKCYKTIANQYIDEATRHCLQTSKTFWNSIYTEQITNIIGLNKHVNIYDMLPTKDKEFKAYGINYNCFENHVLEGNK